MNDINARSDIERLVDAFYQKVRANETLGQIFDDMMQVDWETHLPKMYDFWETALLHKAIYKGNPVQVHLKVHRRAALQKEHFDLWLQLFQETVDENFKGATALRAKTRALSIATIIRIKLHEEQNQGIPIAFPNKDRE